MGNDTRSEVIMEKMTRLSSNHLTSIIYINRAQNHAHNIVFFSSSHPATLDRNGLENGDPLLVPLPGDHVVRLARHEELDQRAA